MSQAFTHAKKLSRDIVSALDSRFGVVGDGAADDTAALQAAINAAANRRLVIPAGSYRISAPLVCPYPIEIVGAGAGLGLGSGTYIFTESTTADVFRIQASNSMIANLAIGTTATRVDGAYINLNASSTGVEIRNVEMTGGFYGIRIQAANVNSVTIDGCSITNNSAAGAFGIYCTHTGVGLNINDCTITGPSASGGNGIAITSPSLRAAHISKTRIATMSTGLVLSCIGVGTEVAGCTVRGVVIDGVTSPVDLNSSAGTVRNVLLDGMSISEVSGVGGGISINANVSSVDIAHCNVDSVTTALAIASGSSRIVARGGVFGQSTVGAAISVAAGASDWSLLGVVATGASTYGVSVAAGASNNYRIIGCDLSGNTSGGLSDAGTGATKIIHNNLGTHDFKDTRRWLDISPTGGGLTTHSAILQAAITECSAKQIPLRLGPGTFTLDSYLALDSNLTIIGVPGLTKIYMPRTMTLGASIGGATRAFYAITKSNIKIVGVEFYSNATYVSSTPTVAFEGITGLTIENCVFRDFGDGSHYAQGLIVFNSTNVVVTDSVFQTCSGDGAAISDACSRVVVSRNIFKDNDDWGFACANSCSGVVISGNIFDNNAQVAVGGADLADAVIAGNVITGGHTHGVSIYNTGAPSRRNVIISGNTIHDVGNAGVALASVVGVVVSGNRIDNVTVGAGIWCTDSERLTITGNNIYDTTTAGILFSASSGGITTGNSIVSGNAVDVCTYGLQQVAAAGTTARVSSFGNMFTNFVTAPHAVITIDYLDPDINTAYAKVNKAFNIPSAATSATATAGGGAALPATVKNFLNWYVDGALKKVPYYDA